VKVPNAIVHSFSARGLVLMRSESLKKWARNFWLNHATLSFLDCNSIFRFAYLDEGWPAQGVIIANVHFCTNGKSLLLRIILECASSTSDPNVIKIWTC
jgi:hypothetical protein